MSHRVDTLRAELDKLYEFSTGDEGLVLTRATQADHNRVAKLAKEMGLENLLTEIAVVAASSVGAELVKIGLRPADYWQNPDLAPALAKRLAKELSDPSGRFTVAFRSVLRGQG